MTWTKFLHGQGGGGRGVRRLPHYAYTLLSTTPSPTRKPCFVNVVAIARGKCGVAKFTTAMNPIVSLALKCGIKVGILNTDVYGPSIPIKMKLHGHPKLNSIPKMIPLENYGVCYILMGFLMEDIALIDAQRCANIFEKIRVSILGLIEKMSFFRCPHRGKSHIFGCGGIASTAKDMNLELLREVPLNIEVREISDLGKLIVVSSLESKAAKIYETLASKILEKLK
ncbi:hypothetical protein L7F22_002859 [Adiantum nelumboides]|nr:hypothetical protein [Adiantum nelumboides]